MAIDQFIEMSSEDMAKLIKFNKARVREKKVPKKSMLRCRNPACLSYSLKRKIALAKNDDTAILRRYTCMACENKFQTLESIYVRKGVVIVVKNDGTREPFDYNKLKTSIMEAAKDIMLFPPERGARIADGISDLFLQQNKDQVIVHSSQITDLVLESLKMNFWMVFMRYASIHKKFKSEEEYKEFITKKGKE